MAELFLLRRLSHDDNYDYSLGRFRCNAGRRLRALGLGADRLLASFGRVVIRTITFGRIRIESDADETRAMAVFCCNAATDFHLRSHHRFTRALMSTSNHLTKRCSRRLAGVLPRVSL